jgi:hypothetical protein
MSGFGSRAGGRRPPPLGRVGRGIIEEEPSLVAQPSEWMSPLSQFGPLTRQPAFQFELNNNGDGPLGRTYSVEPEWYIQPIHRPDVINAGKVTQASILDKKRVKYPFMCDGLLTSHVDPSMVTYLNRLLNKEPGVRVVSMEPMLSYNNVSKMNLKPEEGESTGQEVQLLFNKGESPLNAFEKWLLQVNNKPFNRLKVRYVGQAGSDAGGLRKAFMSELAQEIKQKYCESVFESPLVCRVRDDTKDRVAAMKLDRHGEMGPKVDMNALVTGEAPSMISRTTSVPVDPVGLTTEQRHEQALEVLALFRQESSITSRIAMINMEKKRLLNKHKRLSGEIRDLGERGPSGKVAGARRSSKKVGARSVSGLAKTVKATKNNNSQAVTRLAQLNKEESDLKARLSGIQKEIRRAHAAVYTANDTSKSKKKTTELVDVMDTMKKQIYASGPQRFNFRVTGNTDQRIMERLHVTINTISSALFRHIVKDCVITGQTLSFGLLRLPSVYILTLASLCKSKNATIGSLYELLNRDTGDLSMDQMRFLCEVYNMCVKLDCETYDQMDEHVLAEDRMVELLGNKQAMLNYIKVKEAMYFGNRANKRLVMELFQSVYDKLANSVSISSQVWKTNLCGMTLFRVFMPCFVIEPEELLRVLLVSGNPILQYRSQNPDFVKIVGVVVELIREQDTEDKASNLLNFVRNVTGSLSIPVGISITIDQSNYEGWKPVIVYHTCFNSLDLRVNLLIPISKRSEVELKEALRNYMFGDFSGNMGLA